MFNIKKKSTKQYNTSGAHKDICKYYRLFIFCFVGIKSKFMQEKMRKYKGSLQEALL